MRAAISSDGLVLQKSQIGPYNTELLKILDDLHQQLMPEAEREQVGGNMRTFVIAWDSIPPLCNHKLVCSSSENDFPFSSSILSFPQPH